MAVAIKAKQDTRKVNVHRQHITIGESKRYNDMWSEMIHLKALRQKEMGYCRKSYLKQEVTGFVGSLTPSFL